MGVFWCFHSPQMSNNCLCEQVGAANFVALWNTSRRTAQRSRMQVSLFEIICVFWPVFVLLFTVWQPCSRTGCCFLQISV